MKLNHKKFVFGVRSDMFLGFIVSERGIDVKPDKIKAISNLPELKSIRGIRSSPQNGNIKLASLQISRKGPSFL